MVTYLALPLPAGHACAGDASPLLVGFVFFGVLLPASALLYWRLCCCSRIRTRIYPGVFHVQRSK